jgi:hypothetical protein
MASPVSKFRFADQVLDKAAKIIFRRRFRAGYSTQEAAISGPFQRPAGFPCSCGDLGEMAFGAPRFKGWAKNFFALRSAQAFRHNPA